MFHHKQPYKRLLAACYLLAVNAWAVGLPPAVAGQPLPSLAPMLEQVMPAVVNISTTTNIEVAANPLMQDPFFRQFFQVPQQPSRQEQKNSLGSGVIIDSKHGLVLTNNHVIDKADKIKVKLQDGRTYTAELIGTDPESDVAVIQIPAEQLTELAIADSTQVRVGDFVVAVGNPFGLGQTVTSGIVSALGRSGLGIEGYEDFIQTDASINPGNSGGALVNLRGEFVGMNTAILAPSGGNVGIGFAIPANMAMSIKDSLMQHGEVKRGLLGVTTQDLTPELINAFNLKSNHGAVISRIETNSPAEKAGLEAGDIIIAANGRDVQDSHDIRNIIGLMQIGDKVVIEYYHGNEKRSCTAIISRAEQAQLTGDTLHHTLKGTLLVATQKNQIEGVLISKIDTHSKAWRIGLRAGDVIVSANRYRVHNLDELKQVIAPDTALLINIQRGPEGFFVVLK